MAIFATAYEFLINLPYNGCKYSYLIPLSRNLALKNFLTM